MANKITNGEVKRRGGFVLLGLGVFFLFEPAKLFITDLGLPDVLVGAGLIAVALYYFKF